MVPRVWRRSLQLFLPPKGVGSGGMNRSWLYCLHYTFPATKTSTLARSSGFQVASPIHALVFPR